MAKTYRYCSGVEIDTKNRTILHDDRFIKVYTHNDNRVSHFAYTDDWFKVLANPSRCSFNAHPDKDIQIQLMEYGRLVYPNRLAALYHQSDLPADKFLAYAVELNDRLSDEKKQVDHIDNNILNNCDWNLKIMDASLNSRKRDLVARFKWPYFVSPCRTPAGEYLVEYGHFSERDNALHVRYMRCPTEDALYTFLKCLLEDNAPLELSEAGVGTPGEVLARSKAEGIPTNKMFMGESFDFSVKSYDRKMAIPLDEYPVWII